LDLYRIHSLGGSAQRLTDFPAREIHSTWLPGGDRMIFTSDLDGVSSLFLLDLFSTTTQLINGLPLPASWPVVSPDGRRLAFSAAPDENWDLYLVDLGPDYLPLEETLSRLTTSAGSNISPAWNMDGSALAFASSRSGTLDLFLLSVEDFSVIPLTTAEGNEWAPRWLKDGRLVYHAYDGSTLGAWVLDPGTGSRQLLTTRFEVAAWPVPEP
jgi:TolB protein